MILRTWVLVYVCYNLILGHFLLIELSNIGLNG